MARVKEPVSREAGLFFSNPVIHKEPMGHIIKSNNIILFGLTLCLVFGSVCLYPPLTLWAQDEAPLPIKMSQLIFRRPWEFCTSY